MSEDQKRRTVTRPCCDAKQSDASSSRETTRHGARHAVLRAVPHLALKMSSQNEMQDFKGNFVEHHDEGLRVHRIPSDSESKLQKFELLELVEGTTC